MKRTLLLNFISAGVFLGVQPAALLLAQTLPTATGETPSASPTQPMSQELNSTTGSAGGSDLLPSGMDDKRFTRDVARRDLVNTELAKLASQKSSSDKVKQFGQRILSDHPAISEQVKHVASGENIKIPAKVDLSHNSRYDKLSKLSGGEFDRAYLKDQTQTLRAELRDLKAEIDTGKISSVKQLASDILPILKQQLSLVKSLTNGDVEVSRVIK